MEINLNFVLLEELEETQAKPGEVARLVIVRGSLDASMIPAEDWIRLSELE